jgi:hypothetical protein
MKIHGFLAALVLLSPEVCLASTPDAGTLASLRNAIVDLTQTFGDRYPNGPAFIARLDALGAEPPPQALAALRREALLASPLLDDCKLLFIRRDAKSPHLGLPQNWQGNCSMPRSGFQDSIEVLDDPRSGAKATTFFKPTEPRMLADVDLDFDGSRMLFSMIGSNNRWQIWEIRSDGSGLRQVTPGTEPDVDNYDACYLPNHQIIFASTRVFQGVPCVGGGSKVANLFTMKPDGAEIRQLTFDQDHNWCPTVLDNGRVLYTRWEYSDTPHYYTRILMHMNPDGTGQTEFYGSNSYWPNSLFYARPLPGSGSKVAAIVSGHHGVPRMGELVILDSAAGRQENEGVVQRIPGHNQNVPTAFVDQLVNKVWPKFLHPWPLGEKQFLVSCQPNATAPWGIYLVDVFDNRILLAEEAGQALLEPTPMRARKAPPVIPNRVKPEAKEAVVYLTDIYAGETLAGVPRGTVESLRVVEPHYAYPKKQSSPPTEKAGIPERINSPPPTAACIPSRGAPALRAIIMCLLQWNIISIQANSSNSSAKATTVFHLKKAHGSGSPLGSTSTSPIMGHGVKTKRSQAKDTNNEWSPANSMRASRWIPRRFHPCSRCRPFQSHHHLLHCRQFPHSRVGRWISRSPFSRKSRQPHKPIYRSNNRSTWGMR